MKYKFEFHTELLEKELDAILKGTAEGLEGSSHIVANAVIEVNTELPQDKVGTLCQSVSKALSKKMGPIEAFLVSQEH